MFSLFALLFKAAYWQTLFRADTWRSAWVSLRRVHKDSRARKQLRGLALLCLAPFLCLAYAIWVLRIASVFLFALLIPIFAWQAIRHRRRKAAAAAKLRQEPPHRELTPTEQEEFRTYFAELTLIYAIMLDRAGSERYVQEKVLPEGVQITTRRVHLELLKSRGLWDKMAQRDREALMVPDGGWPREWMEQVVIAFEPLRLMRWLLRIDSFLPAIGQQLRFDYKLANEIVRNPEKLTGGKSLVSTAVIETGRRAAEQYYSRCVAERIHRGYAEAADENSAEIARRIATSLANKQDEDLILGVKLVSEASRKELDWATMLSRRRVGFLHWTLTTMEGGAPPKPPYMFQP